MTKRVLIVSPHFPPINAPDHQRVRMSLPYFANYGWLPLVLTVHPEYVDGVSDPLLEKTLPDDIEVVRTKALRPDYSPINNLALRCLPYLQYKGNALLGEKRIDLVYFSTTMFPVMSLGQSWRHRFGTPYVLDFQDPWVTDYYERTGAPHPPGGKLKHKISQVISRTLEPRALRDVMHVITVSPAYPRELRARYSWLREDQFTVLPFSASEGDFEALRHLNVGQKVFPPGDSKRHWVYVGVAGKVMAKALRILFAAIQRARKRHPESFDDVRLHFVGTDYAPLDRAQKTVEPVAREFGIADLVEERMGRVPYFEALKLLTDSDAIMLLGSDDPGYTASKLYPCILARKPILAVFHEQSTVVDVLRRCNAGRAVTFDADPASEAEAAPAADAHLAWLLTLPRGYEPKTDWHEFEPYTAREMTRRQCEVFDRCVAGR